MNGFISIQADVRAATRMLDDAAKRQVPFATARALTALAFAVQPVEHAAMAQVFARPRPFTTRSVLVNKATKAMPVATVRVRDEAARYLAPFVFGGRHHVPGKGVALLAPVGVRLDAYGQIRGAPRTIGNRPNVFVGPVETKRGLVWGFWQRMRGRRGGSRLRLLIEAAQALPVRKHLDFAGRAQAVVAAQAARVFGRELGQALASAR